jgi:MYXO-CTERM domain-containing protein
VCVEPCHGGEFPCPGGYECDTFGGMKYCVPTTCNDVECPPGASCQDGKCTLDNAGGAGNTPGDGGVGNEPNPGDGGAANAPGSGGAADDAGATSGGSSGSGTTGGSSTGNRPGEGDSSHGVYGLVTGGGGCSCRTAPLGGGKWALVGSLLVLGAALSRRRRAEKRRAA